MKTYYKFELVNKSWYIEGYIVKETANFFELNKAKKLIGGSHEYLDKDDSILFVNKSEVLCYYPTTPPND